MLLWDENGCERLGKTWWITITQGVKVMSVETYDTLFEIMLEIM